METAGSRENFGM